VYQACELATEGKDDSVAAFMSRFFKLGIRVLCSPPTAAPSASDPAPAPYSSMAMSAPGLTAALHPPLMPNVPTSAAFEAPALPPVPVRPSPCAPTMSVPG